MSAKRMAPMCDFFRRDFRIRKLGIFFLDDSEGFSRCFIQNVGQENDISLPCRHFFFPEGNLTEGDVFAGFHPLFTQKFQDFKKLLEV